MLQESLTNVHRHSGTNRAKVRAGINGEAVSMEISDYGHGMSQELLHNFKISGNGVGVGLAGIRERLLEVGGNLDISSSSDGTILRISLPVPNIREAHRDCAASG